MRSLRRNPLVALHQSHKPIPAGIAGPSSAEMAGPRFLKEVDMRESYFNRRIYTMSFLGFSSALPLALTSSTLQAWFTQAGLSLVAVGAVTLVGLPYLWKFLWSPVMDRFVPPFWGRRRGWIAVTQMGLCVTLFILASLHPASQWSVMGIVALIIAFLSASQDIAIDAYRTDVLRPEERGMGTAFYIFACRMAMLVSGGLALILADHVGWRITYEIMATCMALSVIITIFAPEIPQDILPPRNFMHAVTGAFQHLFQREGIVVILLFIATYKIGDALALSLMSNFLLRTLHFSLTDIGIAYKTVGLIAMIIGTFVGGMFLGKLGLFRALLWFGLLQAFSNLTFMVLAVVGKNYWLMTSSLAIENFCSGLSTTALVVFLTALCHKQYSATQFACLSAFSAVGRVLLGPFAGVMVNHIGWVNFYAWTFFLSFPGIILLMMLRHKVALHAEAIA